MNESAEPEDVWRDQVVIVTGGGKGLGRAFALDLGRRGARVIVNNRNRQVDSDGRGPADHVAAEIAAAGGTAIAHHGAVEEPDAGTSLVELALHEWGRLDGVITSAGISNPQMFHKTSPEVFRQVLEVNVMGTVLVTSAAARVMREAGGGRILMVASTAGLHGEATVSAYAASKGAVIALAKTAAVEGAARGVLTNVLLPYATTQMTEQGMDPRYAAMMSPEKVAPVAAALVDPRCQVNGTVIVAGADGIRIGETSEGATVRLPGTEIDPVQLIELIDQSRSGSRRTFAEAQHAFQDFAADLV